MDCHAHVEADHGRLSSHSARLLLVQICSAGEEEPEEEPRSQDFKTHVFTIHKHSDSTNSKAFQTKQFAARYVYKFSSSFKQADRLSSNGTPKVFYFNMGKNYSGPLSFTSGTGISNRVYQASCSGLHKFSVSSSKKGRIESPCSESEAIKSIHNIRTFQNGRYSYVKRPSKTGGLVSKNRPQRWLFNSTHLDKSSEIPSFSVERQHARVCLSPLRFSFCPVSVHEADETSCSSIETAGHSANNLFRRHFNYGRILRPSASSGSFSIESPREFRFRSKLREIPFGANSGDRISGLVSKFKKPYAYFTGRKTKKNSETLQTIARNLGPVDTRVVKVPSAFDLLYSSHIPSPLHFRNLQRLKNQAMTAHQSYEAMISLDQAAREEVIWWRDHLQAWNGKALSKNLSISS